MQADWDEEAFLGSCLHSAINELGSWPESKKKHAISYLKRVIENDSILKKISLNRNFEMPNQKIENGFPNPLSQFDAYWRLQPSFSRMQLGQFYTPEVLVDHIISTCNIGFDSLLPSPYVADIACGSGIFLRKTISAKVKNNKGPLKTRVINAVRHTIGLDKEPIACSLSKLSIALIALDLSCDADDLLFPRIVDGLPLPRVYNTDSLEREKKLQTEEKLTNEDAILEIKSRSGEFYPGLGAIVSNFPFLEAKKMNKVDPNLKDWLRQRYPQLFGAFDIYIAFIYRSLELLAQNGVLGVVLPNKFLIGRYGSRIRKFLLENHKILQISDCSRIENSFRGTGVYPIAFFLRKGRSESEENSVIRGLSVRSLSQLSTATKTAFDANLFHLTGKNYTYFVQPSHKIKLIKYFLTNDNFTRLDELIDLRSTVSFHRKHTREQFVKKREITKSGLHDFIFKYIGGKSYSRKNEVDMFTLNWDGYSIDYNPTHLKKLDHPLPPLKNFLQPKIIFCQHSQRLRAYLDINGEYVTKDVFPIAFPKKDSKKSLDVYTICAYLNSSLFTVIYNSIHHGITIGGGFFHYLPAFLKILPTIKPNNDDQKMLAEKVVEIQSLCSQKNNRDKKREIIKTYYSLDKKVSQIHGLDESAHLKLQREIVQARIPFPWENEKQSHQPTLGAQEEN